MKKSLPLLCLLAFLVVSGWAAYYVSKPPQYAGLACSRDRVATFGWTHRERALAEMAAIMRWQQKAEEVGLEFTEWHHAQRRSLYCRTYGNGRGIYQCRISGTPCRLASKTKAAGA